MHAEPQALQKVRLPFGEADRVLALGIVRREADRPGATVQIGTASATVSTLPFPEAT